MATRKKPDPANFIVPININGLHGRMLRLPASTAKKREILIVYGLHASIERMMGIAEDLSRYGPVTLPDLPGFGGMDSFYRIKKKPSIDNMADYLASFVKLKYRRKRVTILGMSFGFLVVTRMLQKYPELAKRVDVLVSIVGLVHHDDFKFDRKTYALLRTMAVIFSNKYPAWFAQHVILRSLPIKLTYRMVADKHTKLSDADEAERERRIDFEVGLWKCNDIRTQMDTGNSMLIVDLCDKQVDLAVYHVAVDLDRYFDNRVVEQHLNVIFKKVTMINSDIKGHAPTVVADAEAAAPFIPKQLRRILAKK